MTFLRSFHALTFTTAIWAFFALVATGQLHIPAIALFLIFFGLAVWRHRHPAFLRLAGWMWLGITLVAFLAATYGWVVVGARLYSVTYFFLFLEINKLLTAEKNRDYLQIYCLTFFQILAASVSTESILFAPILAVYIFLVIAGMMTFTIKRDAELVFAPSRKRPKNAPPDSASRPILLPTGGNTLQRIAATPYLDRRLSAWLAAFTLIVLVIGSFVFWIVPRTSSPNLFSGLSGNAPGGAISAFSDSIDFTGVDAIQTDPTIVMRAAPAPEMMETRPEFLRIRGTTLDYFSGREWSRSPRLQSGMVTQHDSTINFTWRPTGDAKPMAMQITLEAESSGYLFTIDHPISVVFHELQHLDVDAEGMSLKSLQPRTQPISYTVYGIPAEPAAIEQPNRLRDQLARAGNDSAPVLLRETARRLSDARASIASVLGLGPAGKRGVLAEPNYLQVPRIADMRTVADVARGWTEGLTSDYDRANAIEQRLHNDFNYSLEIPFSRREDHLAYFLTEAKRGHCEYFATSMTLMLRAMGIPARVVNGYLTDEWSPTAKRYIVRQEHAHTWVEARIDDSGTWYTFDPTPASGVGSNRISASFYHGISRWIDAIKVFWYEKYIDFNLDDQRSGMIAFLRALRTGRDHASDGARGISNFWRGQTDLPFTGRQAVGAVLVLAGVVMVAVLGWKLRPRRGPSSAPSRRTGAGDSPPSVREYVRLLRDLQQVRPRAPAETPMAYAAALAGETHGQLDPLRRLTEKYYRVRYFRESWGPEMDSLVAEVRRLLPELKRTPPSPSDSN